MCLPELLFWYQRVLSYQNGGGFFAIFSLTVGPFTPSLLKYFQAVRLYESSQYRSLQRRLH